MTHRRNRKTGYRSFWLVAAVIALTLFLTGCKRTTDNTQSSSTAVTETDSKPESESSIQADEGTESEGFAGDAESPETQKTSDGETIIVIGEARADSQKETTSERDSDSDQTADDTESDALSDGLYDETKPEMDSETEQETETEIVEEAGEETDEEDRLVVAIDPGHQGSWVDMTDTEPLGPGSSEMKTKSSTGTQGTYSGLAEYELNLEIALQLRTELVARGYEVILTREDNDTAISNAERATLAYEQGGDIYVRIHANGSENSNVKGALAMVPSSSNPYVGYLAEDSYLLADCILSAYCETAGFDSLGIQYYDNMTAINWSKIPVMILEMGFITNETDDLRMADASVQALMVQGIADGIDDYFIQKGLKSDAEDADEAEDTENTEDGEDSEVTENIEQMNALIEVLGEGYIYPASETGEVWAVSIESVNKGVEGDINGDVQMKSASVIKVFIMAAIYDRVYFPSSEERKIVMEESYEGELMDLMEAMITVSDNDASNKLITLLGGGDAEAGMDVVNQFLEENGYTGTSLGRLFLEENPSGDNYTTANDCRALLKSIYNGTCVNEEASAAMYAYLKQQTRLTKIPAALTETTAVTSNKTGELAGDYGDYVENDVAIIEDGEQAYILCILSNELNDNSIAIEKIIEMSKLAYDTLIVNEDTGTGP
ncbi:MAG: N-acetylmuramoyl-L-alanine amidase [Lachnospiraceae bacterium]|nr:N-acetylmuramoyl-L-alanine amidase [Lachnospiraceae bacterium]